MQKRRSSARRPTGAAELDPRPLVSTEGRRGIDAIGLMLLCGILLSEDCDTAVPIHTELEAATP